MLTAVATQLEAILQTSLNSDRQLPERLRAELACGSRDGPKSPATMAQKFLLLLKPDSGSSSMLSQGPPWQDHVADMIASDTSALVTNSLCSADTSAFWLGQLDLLLQ